MSIMRTRLQTRAQSGSQVAFWTPWPCSWNQSSYNFCSAAYLHCVLDLKQFAHICSLICFKTSWNDGGLPPPSKKYTAIGAGRSLGLLYARHTLGQACIPTCEKTNVLSFGKIWIPVLEEDRQEEGHRGKDHSDRFADSECALDSPRYQVEENVGQRWLLGHVWDAVVDHLEGEDGGDETCQGATQWAWTNRKKLISATCCGGQEFPNGGVRG